MRLDHAMEMVALDLLKGRILSDSPEDMYDKEYGCKTYVADNGRKVISFYSKSLNVQIKVDKDVMEEGVTPSFVYENLISYIDEFKNKMEGVSEDDDLYNEYIGSHDIKYGVQIIIYGKAADDVNAVIDILTTIASLMKAYL